MENKEKLEALELALTNEEKERDFYLAHARRTKDALGRQMFESIAQFRDAALKRAGRDVVLGVRPEHIGAESEVDWTSDCSITGAVEILEPLGHEVIVHFEVQGETVSGRLRSHAALPAPGDPITLKVRTEAMHLFDPVSELRLS